MRRTGDFPAVFLSYDEPWADGFWDDLRGKAPKALRVHGVKGLDACHKAAARAAGTEWFLTVDADTRVDAAFFDQPVPDHLLNDRFRLTWNSRNAVNGLIGGNGSVKLWPRRLVDEMRTHEAAPAGRVSLDHDIDQIQPGRTMRVTMPGCFSDCHPAMTPFHAFRCGLREALYLSSLGAGPETRLAGTLDGWSTLGAHAPNGPWMIYGALIGRDWRRVMPLLDPRRINDYGWLEQLWTEVILPRFSPGGMTCAWTGARWSGDRLADEIAGLTARLAADGAAVAVFGAEESRLAVEGLDPPALASSSMIDGLGWAFHKGRGVPADDRVARDLFDEAAVLGNPAAIHNLARALERDGEGSPARIEALERTAAALGSPYAARALAERGSEAEGPFALPEGHVALVDPDARIDAWFQPLALDPRFFAEGLCIGVPVRDDASGGDGGVGLRICPAGRAAADPAPDLILPLFAGIRAPDETPEATFRAALAQGPRGAGLTGQRALSTAMGADRPLGEWWLLGTAWALGGSDPDADAAWAAVGTLPPEERRLLTDDLFRQARLAGRARVRPLDPAQCRLVRSQRSPWPSDRVWAAFIEACRARGPALADAVRPYERAAERLGVAVRSGQSIDFAASPEDRQIVPSAKVAVSPAPNA